MFEIEKNVPLPDRMDAGKKPFYPFGEMSVGDSILVPTDAAERVGYALVKWKARHAGWDYATRRGPDGMRVWRTA